MGLFDWFTNNDKEKLIRGDLVRNQRGITDEHDKWLGLIYGSMPQVQDRGNQIWDKTWGGYDDFLNRDKNAGRPNFGGYEGAFNSFAKTGGLDAENIRRMRGGGVFDEFAKTGGLSDADASLMRRVSAADAPSYFDAIRDQIGKNAAVTGAGPSYTSSLQRIARDQSRASADNALRTESGIVDRRREGRMWGGSNMASSEGALANLLSRNKLAGMSGAFDAARAGGDYDMRNQAMDLDVLGAMGRMPSMDPGLANLYEMLLGGEGQKWSLLNNVMGQRAGYDRNISGFDRGMDIWNTISDNLQRWRRKPS